MWLLFLPPIEKAINRIMDMKTEQQWQQFVDKFQLKKRGASPWDANLLAANLSGFSNAERQVILFLLHVWDPSGEWPGGFDFIEAMKAWDDKNRAALIEWTKNPLWP